MAERRAQIGDGLGTSAEKRRGGAINASPAMKPFAECVDPERPAPRCRRTSMTAK